MIVAHAAVAWYSSALTLALAALHAVWIAFAYSSWKRTMPGRLPRDDPRSPSHEPRPPTTGGRFEVPNDHPPLAAGANASACPCAKLHQLNMDHIHVPFPLFLTGFYLLVPSATALWMGASLYLVLRQRLARLGLLKVPPCDYPKVVANLCLDGMEAINFKRVVDERFAEFCWESIPYMDATATTGTILAFKILIDLDDRRMMEASVDNKPVSASRALTLLWFDTVFGTHVKVHAMANWGIAHSVEDVQLAWMQTCTVMYNFFGYTTFSRTITEFWYRTGLTTLNYSDIHRASAMSAEKGVPFHGPLRQLAARSHFVNFMLKVRSKFLHEFSRHKHDFHGADGEALFVGTVMHGLDHVMMDVNLPEPLWLDVDDPTYGAMAELMRHVRVGFVPDLPCLLFNQRCKEMRHPLFREVFKYADSIDPWLARQMDAGICK